MSREKKESSIYQQYQISLAPKIKGTAAPSFLSHEGDEVIPKDLLCEEEKIFCLPRRLRQMQNGKWKSSSKMCQ